MKRFKIILFALFIGALMIGTSAYSQDDKSKKKEKKVVSGLKCKKAVVTSPDMDAPSVVYYHSKFKNYSENFHGLKGLPLMYTISSGGFQMRYTASNMTQEEISADLFEIPSDYEVMTQEEFEKAIMSLE